MEGGDRVWPDVRVNPYRLLSVCCGQVEKGGGGVDGAQSGIVWIWILVWIWFVIYFLFSVIISR